MNKKNLKKIPSFKNENEEFEFWSRHDMSDYFDIDKAIVNPRFPNLKFSTKRVTFRLPEGLLDDLKALANKFDVPYQSMMKIFLKERVDQELGRGKFASV